MRLNVDYYICFYSFLDHLDQKIHNSLYTENKLGAFHIR